MNQNDEKYATQSLRIFRSRKLPIKFVSPHQWRGHSREIAFKLPLLSLAKIAGMKVVALVAALFAGGLYIDGHYYHGYYFRAFMSFAQQVAASTGLRR